MSQLPASSPTPAPLLPLPGSIQVPLGSRWRRLFAFLIDAFLLSLVLNIACLPLFEPLAHLGAWGRLLGFLVAVLYFGYMDSGKGGGQSIGKRLMLIRVVNANGSLLPFERTLWRSTIFLVPIFLSQLPLPVTREPLAVHLLLAVIVFGLGGATSYLLLFNGCSRQGVHDLLTGSYVATAMDGAPATKPVWRRHWIILGSVLALFGLVALLLTVGYSQVAPFPEFTADARLIEAVPGVERSGLYDLHAAGAGQDMTSHTLIIHVVWNGTPAGEESLADHIAATVLQHDSQAQQYGSLQIVISRGFDLGLASSWVSRTFEHPPKDWD